MHVKEGHLLEVGLYIGCVELLKGADNTLADSEH